MLATRLPGISCLGLGSAACTETVNPASNSRAANGRDFGFSIGVSEYAKNPEVFNYFLVTGTR